MDLVWLVYCISLLSGFGGIGITTMIASASTAAFFVMYRGMECNEAGYYSDYENEKRRQKGENATKVIKVSIITCFCSALFLTFLPSEKTAYMMVGAYAAQKVVENDKVQETGGKVLKLINQKLDDYVDEGAKEIEKKAKTIKDKK